MRSVLLALLLFVCPSLAQASVYLSASYRASGVHAGWQKIESKGASAGISIDLGAYIRLGYTYEKSLQTADGYQDPDTAAHEGHAQQYRVYSLVETRTNSVDLQVVLYPGTTVTPYLIGGAAMRKSLTTSWDQTANGGAGAYTQAPYEDRIPIPQGGLGLQIQMNAACSLTLQYIVSPGALATPEMPEGKKYMDGSGSVGIKYKI
jgi:hypothetical protein